MPPPPPLTTAAEGEAETVARRTREQERSIMLI